MKTFSWHAWPTLPETNRAPKKWWLGDDPFLFWETPFSGTFVVSFRESTSFGCQRSLCLRAISGCGKFGGFLNWLEVGGLCKERLFFYGQNVSPLPQNKILVWRCKRILNIFHARWFNQSDLFGEWWISVTLLGMVENVTSNDRGWSLVTSTHLVIVVVWIFLKL